MGIKLLVAGLLSATAFPSTPAAAQGDAARLSAELAAMRDKIDALEAQVAALQAAPAAPARSAPAIAAPPPPAEAPLSGSSGPTIRLFGRLQYDVAHVGSPAGVSDPGSGFGSEVRRARLGVEGTITGGFGYKVEVDFADNQVEITDAFLSYKASKAVALTLGQHNNFQSLEELTSSRFLSFMERAAFTDAFAFERRVGLSGTWLSGDLIAQAGFFTDNIEDLSNAVDAAGLGDKNDALSLDGRLVYAPKLGGTQLHLGGSAHRRDNGSAAATGPVSQYRQRPFVRTTDARFLATPDLRVVRENSYGFEGALIAGPLHATAEVHWLEAASTTPGLSPTFFGGYAEAGLYLTGEARGYKNGRWDRTVVRRPVGKGGLGALQINLRYDHLDLNDGGIVGGKQQAYGASMVWIPQDNVRFLLNYGRLRYEDAAIAAVGGDRDYSIDVFGARAQVDF
jgi:phosphate-selective porin OprO/OprP